MLPTKINSLITSVSGNVGAKENARLYNEIKKHLRSAEVTYNERTKLAQIMKDHLRNGSPEEKEEEEALQVITAICTEDWPDSITSTFFSIVITEEKLNLEECLCAQGDWAIRSKILESVVKASASIPPNKFLNFIHNAVVKSVFMTENETIRTLLSEFVLTLSSSYGIQRCDRDMQQKAFETFKNSYVPVIEDLRKNDNRAWYRLCMFTLSYFGKLIHAEIDLLNVLLNNIEHGFKSKTVEDKLLSFDCWKVLIDVTSLDHSYLCSSKQLKLLVKPCKVKLSRHDQVTCRRLDVWSHLLAALQENSTASLEEFMNFCYEPLPADMWTNGHPAWSDMIKNSWPKRTEILMNLIGHYGHDGTCIRPETFKLNSPVITSANLLKYKSPILNALSVCSENMLFWEVKSAREKKIKCLWGSIFKIISNVDLMTKEVVLRDIFVILKNFLKKSQNSDSQDYFDDILQHVFSVIASEDVSNFTILNDLIVFPLAEVMVGCPELLEYKVITFMKFFRTCSKTGSRLEYFNRSCDMLKTYKHSGTQMLSAYIWLELSNELLSICKAPRDVFEDFKVNAQFLMTFICRTYIPENLEQKIFGRWKSILVEIDVISDLFKENLLDDIEKLLKENPGLSSQILGFLNCISNLMTDKSTHKFVTKLLDIILQCTKNPCLSSAKLRTIVPIITKFQSHISKTDKNKSEPLAVKLFDCIESFLKPHQAYETLLKLFKTVLPKLPQNLKKNIPSTLRSIINDLTTHTNTNVAQDAIALLAECDRNEASVNQTFAKPLVSTRAAKIASMSNGGVASMFAQEVSKSPVRVKGSQIANKVQRSSRTMKIANAMPSFKSSSIDLDANSSDFVFIDKEVKVDTSKLNAHQKEAMSKRREDIPALYQDLSQSQHTNDSMSKGSSCAMGNEEIKSDNFKDVFGNDKGAILDKLAAHALSPKVETVEEKEKPTSAKKEAKKRARLSLKATPKRNLAKTPNVDDRSPEFTDDVLQKDEKLTNEKPVDQEAKTLSLETPDVSSKILDISAQKTEEATPKNKEDQVLVPSDADETLCSQAIEEAQNSETKVHTSTPEKKSTSVQKKRNKRISELMKIKMDIVGADEFVGLGRKRHSSQKVLDDFVSPFRKTPKKADETQMSAVEETQASEPLVPTIGKAAALEDTPRKRGRPQKANLDENTDDKSDNISRKVGRPRKSLPPAEPGKKSALNDDDTKNNKEVIAIVSEIIISEDKAVTNTPAKKKGQRKSIQADHEPLTNEDIDSKISNSDDTAVKDTSKPAKRRARRKSAQMDDQAKDNEAKDNEAKDNEAKDNEAKDNESKDSGDIASSEIMISGDKPLINTPSESGKRNARRPSVLIDNKPTNSENIIGSLEIINSDDQTGLNAKNADSKTEDMTEKPTESEAVTNSEAAVVIPNTPMENVDAKDSTEELGQIETSAEVKGQNDEKSDIENKSSKIIKTPSNGKPRRTRNSLAKEAKEKSLDAETGQISGNKRGKKSAVFDKSVNKSIEAKSTSEAPILIDTPEIMETIQSDEKLSRKRAITKDHEGANAENPTSDIRNTENENTSVDIIMSELCSSKDIVVGTQEESLAPTTFKEPVSKRQKTEDKDEIVDDDDYIIESSQPVETSIYTFNKTGRKSINVKDIQSTVSDEVLKCIVGDPPSSPMEDVIKEEEETITNEEIVAPTELSEAPDGAVGVSDTLVACDVTASCNPDETVASVQEKTEDPVVVTTNRELFPIRRDHILIDLDLDALPMGFDAFEKENLPGSPIADDTTHRTSELLNNTLDISPIIETKEEFPEGSTEEIVVEPKVENSEDVCATPLGTPTRFMKTASSRSAKLMNMLPIVQRAPKSPKSFVRRAQASITSSPTTDRIKRMMMKCNDKVNVPVFDLKDGAEAPHVLEFTRDVPSPFATPNGSILKRKAEDALEAGLSPLPKRKRVNFSDPPTTCEKIYFKEVNDEDSMDGICAISELNVKKSSPIYPPLTECTIDIREVLTHISQENLLDHFLAIDIKTVGDLAKLNSTQINQLEFLSNPRLSTITQALSAFADNLLSNVNHEPSPPREAASIQESSQSRVSSEDVMDRSRISSKVLKMCSDMQVLPRNEMEYIYDFLHKTLKK